MAEADQDPTSPFAIPPPVRITLPEAVDLIELNSDAIWNALLVALGDGRLSAGDHRPEYFRNLPYEQLALLRMPQADLDAIRNFHAIPPGTWRCWIDEDGSIVRTTGEVLRGIPGDRGLIHFRPLLSRVNVLAHFLVAKPAIPDEVMESAQPSTAQCAAAELRRMKDAGLIRKGASISEICRLLAEQMQAARGDDAVGQGHLRNQFHAWGLDKIAYE